MTLEATTPISSLATPMKAIAITTGLSLLAALTTLWKAQASSLQQQFVKLSIPPIIGAQLFQETTSTPQPNSQTETIAAPQPSQPQPTPPDPRRTPQDPCPACGMG